MIALARLDHGRGAEMEPVKESGNEDTLRDLGFDPASPALEAVAKLRELSAKPEVSKFAIARALGAIAHPEAAAMLTAMEANATGALRREIRRSLFRLRQRGISPAQAGAAQAEKPLAAADPFAGLSALISPIDPGGAQVVWITKPRSQGGVLRLWGLLSESEGMVAAAVRSLSRHELRAEIAGLEKRGGTALVEADPRLADFILCEAYRRTPESRRSAVGNFHAIRAEIVAAPPPPKEFEHPIYRELADELRAEPSLDLMAEPEVAGCRFSPQDLAPYLDEIKRVQESPIVTSPASQEQRIETILDRALEELLSAERGARIRRRLENAAYLLLKKNRRQVAGWAAAAAARIRDGVDLKRTAFFRNWLKAQLGAQIQQETERRQAEPRFIMTPAEVMRAQQQAQGRRSNA